MPRYVTTLVPTTQDIGQLERWLREEMALVRASTDDIYLVLGFTIDTFTAAAYGGIGLDNDTALANIDTIWQTLPFDVETVPQPRGVTYSLGSNAMSFDSEGVWRVNAKVSLTFVESQSGRRMTLRLFNVTQGTPSTTVFNFAVGRNTDGINLAFNLVTPIDTQAGDVWVLQVGSAADTFTGVTAIGSVWDANRVSEYKGDIFALIGG